MTDLSLTYLAVGGFFLVFFCINRYWAFPRVASTTNGQSMLPLLLLVNRVIAILGLALVVLAVLVLFI